MGNRVALIAAQQAGVLTRAQALASGLTDDAIRANFDAGHWQHLFTGVYATFTGPVNPPATWWAALLYAGPDAMLSHHSAAQASGLTDPQTATPTPTHVTIPHTRTVRPAPGLVIHRSRRATAMRHPTRLPPQTRIEETVLDLATCAPDLDRAFGWLARACSQHLTTAPRLTEALAERRRVRWRAELKDALDDVAAGCHSLLERRYLHDVERRHALPAGHRQHPRDRPGGHWYDDVDYPTYSTLVELDGRAAHPAESRFRDLRRDNSGVAAGNSVLRYGSADVTHHPCQVAAQVAAVLQRHGWTGHPRPCSPQCPATATSAEAPRPRGTTRVGGPNLPAPRSIRPAPVASQVAAAGRRPGF